VIPLFHGTFELATVQVREAGPTAARVFVLGRVLGKVIGRVLGSGQVREVGPTAAGVLDKVLGNDQICEVGPRRAGGFVLDSVLGNGLICEADPGVGGVCGLGTRQPCEVGPAAARAGKRLPDIVESESTSGNCGVMWLVPLDPMSPVPCASTSLITSVLALNELLHSPTVLLRAELPVAIHSPAHAGRDCHPTTTALSTLQILISTYLVHPTLSLLDFNFQLLPRDYSSNPLATGDRSLATNAPSFTAPHTTTA
jgi:hypothetical protein